MELPLAHDSLLPGRIMILAQRLIGCLLACLLITGCSIHPRPPFSIISPGIDEVYESFYRGFAYECEYEAALPSMEGVLKPKDHWSPLEINQWRAIQARILFTLGREKEGTEVLRAMLAESGGWQSISNREAVREDLRLAEARIESGNPSPAPYAQPCTVLPEHPRELLEKNGFVVALMSVHPSGRVQAVHISSSSHAIFEEKAVNALLRWRYSRLSPAEDSRVRKFGVRIYFTSNSRPHVVSLSNSLSDELLTPEKRPGPEKSF